MLSPLNLYQLELSLFDFLIFYVLSDLFLVESDGIYAVPFRPEMIAPVRFTLQIPELVEYPYCCATFDNPDIIRNRHLWRDHYQQMNMVDLNVHLYYFASLLF